MSKMKEHGKIFCTRIINLCGIQSLFSHKHSPEELFQSELTSWSLSPFGHIWITCGAWNVFWGITTGQFGKTLGTVLYIHCEQINCILIHPLGIPVFLRKSLLEISIKCLPVAHCYVPTNSIVASAARSVQTQFCMSHANMGCQMHGISYQLH